MTLEEALRLEQSKHHRKTHNNHEESDLQVSCFRWMRYAHPTEARVCFHVPNGGRRDKMTGYMLKNEGVLPGVADVLLLKSTKKYGYLCIELKTEKGKQSQAQKDFQKAVEESGGKYVVVRSLANFIAEVGYYLEDR